MNGRLAPLVKEETVSSLRRMAILLRPYGGPIALVMAILFVLTAVNMVFPLFLKLLLDEVFPHRNWMLLGLILVGILGAYILRQILYFRSKYTALSIGENVSFALRSTLFERMQQMSLRFYRQHTPGQITSRVMNDSFVVQSFIQDELPKLLQSLLLFVGLIATIYAINWQLALASTIVLPLHMLTARFFRRPIKESGQDAQEQLAVVQSNLIEKFLGVEVVKGFTAEDRESKAFNEAIDRSRVSGLRSKRYHVSQKIVADLLVGLGTIGLLGFGGYQVMKDGPTAMQPGTFIAFFGYVAMLYPNVLQLMSGFAKLTRTTASIDRIYDLLETTGQQEIAPRQPLIIPIRGHLRFEAVSFRYVDGPPLLKNITLDVPAGRVCAIVGPSGSGKSTFVSLVPRLLEPDIGRISLDGVDLRRIDLRHLRESIGIAFQECFLFNSTIMENLRYADPDAPVQRIMEVARRVGAHSFIMKLPDGYHTMLGDRGVELSRGEKQRISLVRAMLKRPRILILDEATASIDLAGEDRIIPAILDLMAGKTTLMVTHRRELLRHADLVMQLVDGRVGYYGPPGGLPADVMTASASPEAPDVAYHSR